MSWTTYFALPAHHQEKQDLPLLVALADRYAQERPFQGLKVVFGHLLVRNSLVVAETLLAGGAELVISEGFASPVAVPLVRELSRHGIPVLTIPQAVQAGAIFLDVDALLGRVKTPRGAAEATRTGVRHYERIPCPVVSADDCRAKRIEGFYGTGEGFLKAWQRFFPDDEIAGKRLVQFGYGKIGRGVAHRTRAAGLVVTVVEKNASALERAVREGFPAIDVDPGDELQKALAQADIVISVTGVPGVLSRSLPPAWLRANRPVLVNQGAEDEFGPAFADEEILGGRQVPLNFHLEQPTPNRYVDPALAAHVLALEALVAGDYPVGVHPLPEPMDSWLVNAWRRCWPREDLTGIGPELGLA